jgi:DNA-binding MarR family transcriptional regulator
MPTPRQFAEVSERAVLTLSMWELKVYIMLRAYAGKKKHDCFVTVTRIAKDLKLTTRTVRRHAAAMIQKGALQHSKYLGLWRWYFPWERFTGK